MNNLETIKKREADYRAGIISILLCEVFWGVLPIYWKYLIPINSYTIIVYRIVLMALACFLFASVKDGVREVVGGFVMNKKRTALCILAGFILTINWSVYIWAVNQGYVIQTAMGYYFEPILICLFGIIFFKEKVTKYKVVAIFLACIGFGVMIYGYREFPMVAIAIGLTFAVYSAIKKSYCLPAITSLLYETIVWVIPASFGIYYMETHGYGAFGAEMGGKGFLLLFAGIATILPLGFYSHATNRLPLVTIGLYCYISPSIALVLGIFLFKENFDIIQFSAFAIVWVGLVIFSLGEIRDYRRLEVAEHSLEKEELGLEQEDAEDAKKDLGGSR